MGDFLWAAPVDSPLFSSKASSAEIRDLVQDPSQLQIPFQYASLEEIHKGTNGKLLIYFQDAHTNFGAQKNLASALEVLMKRYGISTCFVEGGDRDVSLHKIRRMAPKKTWDILAKRLLQDGILTGAEHLNLTFSCPLKLLGVEYGPLARANLKVYSQLLKNREDVLSYVHQIQGSLERLKRRCYPKELLSYERSKVEGRRWKENQSLK
ncbi:MAG: hypothetical protein HY593_02985, partial [Candidatus Omnitrophica bacterium]|nr:hypothetical protein [Candidatus Omnitrophota bacterium]